MYKIIFFIFLFFIATVPHVLAASNFITSFNITYTVGQNGLTHAVFAGQLQNTSDKFYASSYTLKAGFDDMENIQAFDTDGGITPVIKTTDTGKSVTLDFNHRAVGDGSILNFTFAFDTTDIAKHIGKIWEINIPGLADQADFKDFAVHLRVPNSFGAPTYIKPTKTDGTLDFGKNDLGASGIALAFGKQQLCDFHLHYHLKNDNLFPVKTEIALPPSTNYQEVAISDISPRPLNVTQDTNGNWLASYSLYPSQSLNIIASGTITLSLFPKIDMLTLNKRNLYLQAQPYWETQNAQIQQVASELKTPHAIFDYVVNHLHYDFSRIAGKQERLGAANVFANPDSAVCLEFTDLFIALARAAGIPAREVDGYAYTQNKEERPLSLLKDVLHAWPEYYDDNTQTWVMVDPTWQNTTKGTDYFDSLDFDHVAFVIKGTKSEYPVPAGGYKLPGQEDTRDVYVDFNANQLDNIPKISFDATFPNVLFAGLQISGDTKIQNVGNTLVPAQTITIDTPLSPHHQILTTLPIPPFGYVEVPITFAKTDFLTNSSFPIRIQVAGDTEEKSVRIYPFYFQNKFIEIGGIIIGILCIGLLIIAARAWCLSIFRR